MLTVSRYIRNHLLFNATRINLHKVLKSQWSNEFETLRKNRMVMGYFRYGPVLETRGKYDNFGSILKRLNKFKETGNTEHLVDIANLCMIEFMNGNHPKKHFRSTDDEDHTEARVS